MPTCPDCGAELPDGATACTVCGTDPNVPMAAPDSAITNADYDPDAEKKRFERRYGINIGDRTVAEYLAHLDQQDYSATPWFWLVVVAEVAGIFLFSLTLFGRTGLGLDVRTVFVAISVLLALAIFVDTRVVGQFTRWAKIRWTYILLSAIPLVGHLSGVLYLVLRRLMHEQATEYRRRLLNAGFDLGPPTADD